MMTEKENGDKPLAYAILLFAICGDELLEGISTRTCPDYSLLMMRTRFPTTQERLCHFCELLRNHLIRALLNEIGR